MRERLLFVESNTTGTGMLALATARRLGFEPVFLTADPGRYRGLDEAGATVLRCDTNSRPDLHRVAAATPGVAGITTTSEFYLLAVAELAAYLGLPGNPPAAVRTARDKAAVRRAFGRARPRFVEVRSVDEVAAAVRHTGLPCVVKPVDDSGSNNVRICTTAAEAVGQAATVLGTRVNARGQRTAGAALVEQYVEGEEFSVEMLSVDGVAECAGITRKRLTGPPYCVETGHLYPADLPPATAQAVLETVRALLSAVGVHTGPTHTEVRLGPDGPVIVELNCRLAGGMIPHLVRLATGVDLIEEQLRCATGARPRLPDGPHRRWAGIRFLTAARAGTFAGVVGLEAARQVPGVVEATVTMRPGTPIDRPRNAYDRAGFVIAAGDSPAAVERTLTHATAFTACRLGSATVTAGRGGSIAAR